MSIAGIAKEVSTILVASWFFGDKLTLLNAAGVLITVCGEINLLNNYSFWLNNRWTSQGIGLFTHHKYRKSIESTVPVDAHGNPIIGDYASARQPWNEGLSGTQPEETILLTSRHGDDDLLVQVRRPSRFQLAIKLTKLRACTVTSIKGLLQHFYPRVRG